MAYRDYSTAHGHIVDATGQGDFTTIQAAINAAVAGDTIFVRPGSYVGATLTPGVNLCSFGCEGMGGSPPNVLITSALTLSTTGTVNISGFSFQVSGNAIVVSGAFASFLNLDDCYFTINVATAISFTNSNASSQINLRNCSGNTGTNTVAIWASTSAGSITLYDCDFTNLGSSTAANTCASGQANVYRGTIGTQISYTGTGQGFLMGVEIDTSAGNTTSIVADGGAVVAFNCLLNSGSATAATVNNGLVLSQCFIGSGAANAIDGAGTLFYSDLTFGSANTIATTTLSPQNWQPYSTAGSSGAAVRGTSAFDSTYFSDVNGWVSLIAAPPPVGVVTKIGVDAFTGPGTNPVVPDGSGQITVTGGQVAAGTTVNVIRTDSLAANDYTIQIQRSQAVGSSTIGDNGVSHFNSASFTVDANGFVSLVNAPITGTATTVGAVNANTISVTLPLGGGNAGTYLFETNTVGHDGATPSGGTLNEIVGILYDGATATIMPTPGSDLSSVLPFIMPSIAEYYTTVSANVVSITVQGTAGLTVNWFSSLTFIKVT